MSIQILSPQLANQIAAGEVVERPSSVVKELVENSLDAGATRIDIEIERGGAKMIRIRDNGCGINKDELALAMARHATSKISSLDDLEAIMSMGFRGEALASISSVSRLTLTSRTQTQTEAWQAYAEGRDMDVSVKPAAHPVGTTLEVLDLFYNTPARRKFLRSEKTEFAHIDEVVRRIALARFDVTFTLTHNGKMMRQYRAVKDKSQYERRLGSICGAAFLQQALAVSWQHGDLNIRGWVIDPQGDATFNDMQYFYVNNRMMRDRVINHGIRQAYQDQLIGDQQPAFVLYLDMDPHQVDVNVHPAKHEVRFHQARLVHDFIYQAVCSVLQQAKQVVFHGETSVLSKTKKTDNTQLEHGLQQGLVSTEQQDHHALAWQEPNRTAAGDNTFAQPHQPVTSSNSGKVPSYQPNQGEAYNQFIASTATPHSQNNIAVHETSAQYLSSTAAALMPKASSQLAVNAHSFGRVLMIVEPDYAVLESVSGLSLLSLSVAEQCLRAAQLTPREGELKSQPLLIPLRMTLTAAELSAYEKHQSLLQQLGLSLSVSGKTLMVKAVPLPLRQQNLQQLLAALLMALGNESLNNEFLNSPSLVAQWLAAQIKSEFSSWSVPQAIQLLADVERLSPDYVATPPTNLLHPIDLSLAIAALNDELNKSKE